jgi:hypothetical protein
MKFVAARPFADPEVATRKLLEIANSVDPAQDGRTIVTTCRGYYVIEVRSSFSVSHAAPCLCAPAHS